MIRRHIFYGIARSVIDDFKREAVSYGISEGAAWELEGVLEKELDRRYEKLEKKFPKIKLEDKEIQLGDND